MEKKPVPLMLRRVISGGQTGVDQAALRVAREFGIPTGGTAPKSWRTTAGASPWLADFGLVESEASGYAVRTRANVGAADATLILARDIHSPGTELTIRRCGKAKQPFCFPGPFGRDDSCDPTSAVAWILAVHLKRLGAFVLNVAGNSERTAPGITEQAETFLRAVFGADDSMIDRARQQNHDRELRLEFELRRRAEARR